MERPVFNGVKSLEVEFQKLEYGLIYFTMRIDEESVETNFSDVYNPLHSFKHWLEAVSVGVEKCSFTFDDEGKDWEFCFEQLNLQKSLFTVKEPYDNPKIFLNNYVERRQIVDAFYNGFLNFCNSSKFNEYGWAAIKFSDRLTKILEIEYDQLVDKLSKFGRKQLNDWLCQVAPRYWVNIPTETEEAETAKLLKAELENAERLFDKNLDRSEIHWNIPLDYSDWNIADKRKLVEECLSEDCTCHYGSKIEDFKSNIIEDFLNSHQ